MNAIIFKMMERHPSDILSALSALGHREDSLDLADRWQQLYDAGEATDLYLRQYSLEETADVLWDCLCDMLKTAWLESLTREQALTIGNALGVLDIAQVELTTGCGIRALSVPDAWNRVHPDEKPILRTSSSLM